MKNNVNSEVVKARELLPAGSGEGALEHEKGRPPVATDSARNRLAHSLGLHPLVAFGMFACDWMLFGGEAGSAGIGLALTIPIALALMLPCILIQRYSFKDGWGAAIGKGLLVGVLTAIPLPIGSPVTLAGGVIGLFGSRRKPLPAAKDSRLLPPKRGAEA